MACPVLGTVRVAEAPGSRAAAGRRAAIAERPLGLEGRPGNLRAANHTITDVTGRTKAVPVIAAVGLALPPDDARWPTLPATDAREIMWRQSGRGSRLVGNPFAVQWFRPASRGRPPRVSMAIAISASGEW